MEIRPGSMGKPAPGYEVGIVDDDGHRVDVGQRGNIGVRSTVEDGNGNVIKHPGNQSTLTFMVFIDPLARER
jgi:acyl-coenzyme A synthetase/AMP-(fatty) acid ligase